MSNILQKPGQARADAPATDAGQSQREAAAQQGAEDDKIRAALEKEQAYWARHGPAVIREERQAAMVRERTREQIQANIQANIQARIQKRASSPKNHTKGRDRTIESDDAIRARLLNMPWGTSDDLTYADLFPWMYEGKNIKAKKVPKENFPYLGDSVRVIKKGSCGCEHCCCADYD